MIRLLVADSQPIYVMGLQRLFEEEDGFQLVATCSAASGVVPAIRKSSPDIVVIDLRIDESHPFATVRAIGALSNAPHVVILTASLRDDDVFEAVRTGVRGVVLKTMSPALLLQCLRKVHAGGRWLEKDSMGRAIESLLLREERAQEAKQILTTRELEVLRMASSGRSNKKIAADLLITEGTVKMHLHSIYEKLQISGRVELIVYARENRLLDADRRRARPA